MGNWINHFVLRHPIPNICSMLFLAPALCQAALTANSTLLSGDMNFYAWLCVMTQAMAGENAVFLRLIASEEVLWR
jgi:hypothetical protein